MRILFIVDDTLFFLPDWLEGVLKEINKSYKIVALTPLITKKGPTLYSYLMHNIPSLGFQSTIKLAIFTLILEVQKFLFTMNLSTKPVSLHQVAKKYHLKIIESENVNDQEYLKKVKKMQPDIIISSCSQIFKKEILNIPKVACINRHSALLPSYGGVFPIFRAMINKERLMGVTVHFMSQGIDKGKPIYQMAFPAKKSDTLFNLYKIAYQVSVRATVEALKILNKQGRPVILGKGKPSYYSFPSQKDWQRFWKNKFKII